MAFRWQTDSVLLVYVYWKTLAFTHHLCSYWQLGISLVDTLDTGCDVLHQRHSFHSLCKHILGSVGCFAWRNRDTHHNSVRRSVYRSPCRHRQDTNCRIWRHLLRNLKAENLSSSGFFERKIVIIFLPMNLNMCFGAHDIIMFGWEIGTIFFKRVLLSRVH